METSTTLAEEAVANPFPLCKGMKPTKPVDPSAIRVLKPLFNPDAPNAVVLYRPSSESEREVRSHY